MIKKQKTVLSDNSRKDINKISDKLKKISGNIILPTDFDEKKELLNYLENKHL